jgi:hypothetical protein
LDEGYNISYKGRKYGTLDLVKDLRKEIQKYPELLAQIFNERVKRYTDRDLSRFWRGNNHQYIRRVKSKIQNSNSDDYNPEFRFSDSVGNLKLLEKKLIEKYQVKAIGCIKIIKLYKEKNSEIKTLQFIDIIKQELGRISGDLRLTDQELSLILAGYDTFIRNTLDIITNRKSKRWYNPEYKFTRERLNDFRESLKELLGYHAKNGVDLISKYERLNPNLDYWHPKNYYIKNANYFNEIDTAEKSYWFGFLYSDGHLSDKRPRIQFELSAKDKDRIEQFIKTIGLDMDRIEIKRRFFKYKRKIVPFKTARIRFSSKIMSSDLKNLGFKKFKIGKLGIPHFIRLKINEAHREAKNTDYNFTETHSGKIALAFLLGFYDGDGTYMGGKQAKIYSTNKKLLEEIKSLYNIKNNINLQSEIYQDKSEDLSIEDRTSHKSVYYLTLGPEIFDGMMGSYDKSMKRKRPLELF